MSSAASTPAGLRRRIDQVRERARKGGLSAVMITPGPDLGYLTGLSTHSHERLTALVIPSDAVLPVAFVSPALEFADIGRDRFDALGIEVRIWRDEDDPFRLALRDLPPGPIAVSDLTPALHTFALRDAGAGDLVLAGPAVADLRMRKDSAELAELGAAGAAIDRVHARVADWLRPGRTEREVAADIAAAIVEEGHATAEFVIVGSGPNGANPHHSASDRVLARGDLVVVDIGGPMPSGYCSDSTRTYALGTPAPAVGQAYAVLQQAQQAAVEAVRPGISAESVDRVARDIITAAGFGENFIHRTGHGIGLEVHEHPYIVERNQTVLEPGMTFSIEPGIYVADTWGARIEDIVAVTASGVEALNKRPHELLVL
ncbi:M24 family metallopeptidase [Microlunatus soli]|uniref:Xaa-Pro aminopeptidase n=1 Tax=Microlunatus soli TaxID=630515 RepID=A0A1H1XUV5_9ACTN|nr:Xaa-Pro peptidase family protein [Microlunatus soli]SDT12963.1 Xaa-Pro aminopeptidase [Microlunatus soli]